MDSMEEAAEKVVETSEFATIALIAVAACSLLGLGIGLYALGRLPTETPQEATA